jgi:hypothetical protein
MRASKAKTETKRDQQTITPFVIPEWESVIVGRALLHANKTITETKRDQHTITPFVIPEWDPSSLACVPTCKQGNN